MLNQQDCLMYFYYLTPKDLLINKRFHKNALTLLLENIVLKFKSSIIHPGETVGVIQVNLLRTYTNDIEYISFSRCR